MRQLYVTFQHQDLLDELLLDDFDAVRPQFRFVLYDECLTWLLDNGAGPIGIYRADTLKPLRARLPFVPHLGAVRITPKAQVEHRAFGDRGGYREMTASWLPSSPTGIRIVLRTDELVSEHRLTDTYESPANREWNRRLAREGVTDHLVSDDQSTWHVAISIEPRQRIEVQALTDDAHVAAAGARISARPYIHIYPHGGMTTTLGLSLLFHEDRSVDEVIDLLRLLLRRPEPAAFAFRMRGLDPAPAQELIRHLSARAIRAVAPEARVPSYVHLDYAVSVSAEPDELSDAQLAGLLQLDDRYEIFSDEWIEARASLYGRYRGDRVVASRTGLAVTTSPRHFSRSGHRRFFWRCHAIKELATMQARVLDAVADRLRWFGTASGPDEMTTRRLQAIAEHLIEFPRGLPAHHRKWFYECQRLAHGMAAMDGYYDTLAALHERARHTAIMRRMDDARSIRISITNSNVGTLNLGNIIGDVESHLSDVRANDANGARDALRTLAEAIVNDDNLEEHDRRELLESVDLLAEEAAKPPAKRRGGAVRAVLASLATSLSAAGGLAELWTACEPALRGFFG